MILSYDSCMLKKAICQYTQSVVVRKWLKTGNIFDDNGISVKRVVFNIPGLLLAVDQRVKKRLPFCCIR